MMLADYPGPVPNIAYTVALEFFRPDRAATLEWRCGGILAKPKPPMHDMGALYEIEN
jgi:hypothetical protein